MWLSWLEHCPINRKVAGPIPWSGNMSRLQVRSLVREHSEGNQLMLLSRISVSLPLSPSLPLSLKSINMLLGEDKKKNLPIILIEIVGFSSLDKKKKSENRKQ